jgi:hypothetical protein
MHIPPTGLFSEPRGSQYREVEISTSDRSEESPATTYLSIGYWSGPCCAPAQLPMHCELGRKRRLAPRLPAVDQTVRRTSTLARSLCGSAWTKSHNMDDVQVNDSRRRATNKTMSALQPGDRLEWLLAQSITHDVYSNIHDNEPHAYICYRSHADPTPTLILISRCKYNLFDHAKQSSVS